MIVTQLMVEQALATASLELLKTRDVSANAGVPPALALAQILTRLTTKSQFTNPELDRGFPGA